MADKIQLRRDTAANWTSADPILAQGEQGYELDTGKIKIGDGITNWSGLSYQASGVNDHTLLSNIGINTHDQIDTHISNNSNPHNVQATQISDFDTEVSNNTDVSNNTAKVSFPEAPTDGQQYARQNSAWSVVSGGGSSPWVNALNPGDIKYDVGRVGIGGDPDTDAALHIRNDSGNDLVLENSGIATKPQVIIKKSRGTQTSKSALLNSDVIGGFEFHAFDGSNYRQSSLIEARMKQDAITNGIGSELRFQTTAVFNTTPITRMVVQENGNVNFNNNRLEAVATPINGTDGVNKDYVDSAPSSNQLGWAQFSSTGSQSFSFDVRQQILFPSYSLLNTNGPAPAPTWVNQTNSRFFPDSVGDFYILRFTADFTANQSDKEFTIDLDIGGTQGIIWENTIRTPKSGGQTRKYSFSIPIFTLGTFTVNGASINVTFNTSGTVANPSLLINKVFKA